MTEMGRSTGRRVRFGDVVTNTKETVKNPVGAGLDRVVALEHMEPGSLQLSGWQDAADGTTFTRRFRAGQTLFAKRRAYQRKVAYAEFDGVCSGDILAFEAKSDELLPELLPFIVQSDAFFEHALRTSAGSLSPRTKWQDLATWEFDLPSLDEQQQMAGLLWCFEHAVRSYRVQRAAARRAVTAWIESRVAGSSVRPLSDLADVANGRTFSKALQGRAQGDVPFFKVLDYERCGNEKYLVQSENYISFEELSGLGYKLVKPGAVVMARVGAAIAQERRRIINRECVVDDNQLVIMPRAGLNPEYLWLLLREVRFSDGQNEGVVPSVNQTQVGAVSIPLENEREQATTVDFCLAAENVGELSRESAEACRQSARALINELMGRAR